jgi:hypothetical protein
MGCQVENCLPYCAHFLTEIADFHLKYCILGENAQNTTSGETVEKVPKQILG